MASLRAALLGVLVLTACSGGGDGTIETVFAPCEPLVLAPEGVMPDDTRESLELTLAMWNRHGVRLSLEPTPGVPVVPIRFEEAAGNFHGVYEDELGVIYVNLAITDPHQRAVTIAHEVGHAFGLLHVDRDDRSSVMNRGNVVTEPLAGDRDALAELWGACD